MRAYRPSLFAVDSDSEEHIERIKLYAQMVAAGRRLFESNDQADNELTVGISDESPETNFPQTGSEHYGANMLLEAWSGLDAAGPTGSSYAKSGHADVALDQHSTGRA